MCEALQTAKNRDSNASFLGFPVQPVLGPRAVFGLLSYHYATAAVTFRTDEFLCSLVLDEREEVLGLQFLYCLR